MKIKADIIKTLAFFDLFDRPLLDTEIQKYLIGEKADLRNIRNNLRKMVGREIGRKGNLYSLKGREAIFETFKERRKISKGKIRKAKFVAGILRVLPFVRGIAITQNTAIENAKKESDIDFLIITAQRKIWISRFFVNLVLDVLRLRSSKNKSRICPNFLLSRNNLDISSVAIKDDIYLAFWARTLRPVFGASIFNEFQRGNRWIKEFMPRATEENNSIWLNPISYILRTIFEIILLPFSRILEGRLRKVQEKKIEKNKKKAKNESIVISEKMIKIHYDDMREHYRNEWKKLVELTSQKLQ